MKAFSIIIPVYNAQKYLCQCIDSVLQQSFQDYEIILIDDGSEDLSAELCCEYERVNDCISFFSISHSGAGAARNEGLKKSKGKYILFLDADDYWNSKEVLSTIYHSFQQSPSEVLMFQIAKVTENGDILERYRKKPFGQENRVCQLSDVYSVLVKDGQMLASACNKCILSSTLKDNSIFFLEGVIAEDIDWVLQLFSVVKTIQFLDENLYSYRQHRSGSASRDKNGPDDQARMIENWLAKLQSETLPNPEAVAGVLAFEYAICMGYDRFLSSDMKKMMRRNQDILKSGMDVKTKLIYKMDQIIGYNLTSMMIQVYLFFRRIW